jgi:hypothetical protein
LEPTTTITGDRLKYFLFFLAVLISRLPFLSDGYGLDGDSWAVALAAKNLHDTGVYEASRLPGYPVQEMLSAVLINGGATALNALVALISAMGILFFALSLKALRFRRPLLAAAALAAVPVIYIHSTTTIDYNIALGFLLASFYFVVTEKPLLAGLLTGLAIGTRVTSGAMMLPYIIILIGNGGLLVNLRRILRYAVPALLIGLLCFLPVILRYGWGFLTYYPVPYPSIAKILYKFTFEVWGVVGLFAIVLAVAALFLPNRITAKRFLFPRSVNERYVIAWLIAIDLYVIAFLRLPMESGYLAPVVPFVILIFGKYLFEPAFRLLCILLILSPFIGSIGPVERLDAARPSALSYRFQAGGETLVLDALRGPIVAYKSRRQEGMRFTREILNSVDSVSRPSVLVSGRWYNQLVVQEGDTTCGNMVFASYLDEPMLLYYIGKNYTVYYLPRQDYYNQVMRNVDLNLFGALPYIREERY